MSVFASASWQLRPAVAADRWSIRRIVVAARLNPLDLNWRRFLVAERAGRIAGTIQVRHHTDAARELASLAVMPWAQGDNLGAALIEALCARTPPPLYLVCAAAMVGYYERFGFRPIAIRELPAGMRTYGRLTHAIVAISRASRLALPRPVFMRFDAPAA